MSLSKISAVLLMVLIACGAWYAMTNVTPAQDEQMPVVIREEKAEPPNLPKPPSFVVRVMQDNPHLDQKTAEQFEQERISINVAHQEYRMKVLKEAGTVSPEELIEIEQELAGKLHKSFVELEVKYDIAMKKNPPGFLGAPVPLPQ